MFSIADLITFESKGGEYTWYAAEPDKVYPKVLLHLMETQQITIEDYIFSNMPRHLVPDAEVERRAAILDKARVSCTLRLVEELGNGSCIHWLNDPRWRQR